MSKRMITVAMGLALGLILAACGSTDKKTTTAAKTNYTFTADINPIIKASCANSACHGTTSPGSIVYVDNETNFKAEGTKISTRLNLATTDTLFMPQNNSETISAADKQKLIDFMNQ